MQIIHLQIIGSKYDCTQFSSISLEECFDVFSDFMGILSQNYFWLDWIDNI